MERLTDQVQKLALQLKGTEVSDIQGLLLAAQGIANYNCGRWRLGRDACDQAEAILRSQCTGLFWELNAAQNFGLWNRVFLGEYAELARSAPMLLAEARERGDLYAEQSVATFAAPHVAMSVDDVADGHRALDDCKRYWPVEGYQIQQLAAMLGRVDLYLYSGDGEAAWRFVSEQWPALKRSLLLRIQVARVLSVYARGRAALGVAATGARDRGKLLKLADADARRLERVPATWAQPLAMTLRATVAIQLGRNDRAIELLQAASTRFEESEMPVFSAAAHDRRGELIGGDQGRALRERAAKEMISRGISRPERMTAAFIPIGR
jgi:hypothetical protein